jgi:hypothetical protein
MRDGSDTTTPRAKDHSFTCGQGDNSRRGAVVMGPAGEEWAVSRSR